MHIRLIRHEQGKYVIPIPVRDNGRTRTQGKCSTCRSHELLDLLALCAASTVNALPSAGTAFEANALAVAVGLDMADWWTPTVEGFLQQVSKAQIVQALKEAGPRLATDGVEGMKKDALVNTAAAQLAGKRWLPATLRRPQA